MPPRPSLDPRLVLGMNMVTQPGVYALLIGSGVSTGAGIPTGWGVVERLVRRVAAGATDRPPIESGNWEGWWNSNYPGVGLGYSSLLEALGPTAASRSALLANFFVATPADRADGLRVPGPAHAAIAALVAQGIVRVIVTTNFDQLIEHALDAADVRYQVVSSDDAIAGMEPLAHANATVLKLHGDYTSLAQRNTLDELTAYPEATKELLSRIFDEYGLVIAGWSGEWDHALVAALQARTSRRYPLVWTAFSSGGAIAQRLTAAQGDALIENAPADAFFTDLVSRVDALEAMTELPVSLDVKLGRLRRALPDPVRYLEVRTLFETELDVLRTWAAERSLVSPVLDAHGMRNELTSIRTRFAALTELFARGIELDRDRQHTDLWVWVLQQARDIRADARGASTQWWEALLHLPAFYLLRAGILATLASKHEDVAVRLCVEPRWRSVFIQQQLEFPAHEVLSIHRVLNKAVWGSVAEETEGRAFSRPSDHLANMELTSLAKELFGAAATELALARVEYRLALASILLRPGVGHYRSAAVGEFSFTYPHRPDSPLRLPMTGDFLLNGDVKAWQSAAIPPVTELEPLLESLDQRFRAIRDAEE